MSCVPGIASKGVSEILESKPIAPGDPRYRNILIVESDPDLQWQLARMLTVEGNRVIGTSSPDGALTVIDQWDADLVLIAENLPGMGGLRLAERLRERFPATPVILMAEQRSDVQVRDSFIDAAATLIKPFRFEALRALIESIQLAPTPAE